MFVGGDKKNGPTSVICKAAVEAQQDWDQMQKEQSDPEERRKYGTMSVRVFSMTIKALEDYMLTQNYNGDVEVEMAYADVA